jgi:ribosomal protein S18 acetylase RimI-like enzyme
MVDYAIQYAAASDAPAIVKLIRLMVTDMAGYGGHAPASDPAVWQKLEGGIADEINRRTGLYAIAQSPAPEWLGIAGAQIGMLGGAFAPRKTLHVSMLYVPPSYRRGGIGEKLLARLLDWGRAQGAELCDLNVLSGNPARGLYEKAGFSVFQLQMTQRL